MKKLLGLFLAMLAVCLLAGCRTTRLAQTQIVHDSVFQTRDSIVIRLVKDSVSEREKTTIQTKHDTINGTDTVFVIRERIIDRWKIRTDTVQKVVYVKTARDSIYIKQPVQKTKEEKEKSLSKKIFLGALVAWIAGFIYLRLRR
ncbi:MAG: hypothetical protein E7L36_00250 [Prevotella bivia]|nr:hypothetical protein [Prevotella bivia]